MDSLNDAFRRGDSDIEKYFQVFNYYSDEASKYTPFNPHLLTRQEYHLITNSLAQYPYILSNLQSNIGQNGGSIIVNTSDNNSTNTIQRKELLKKRMYTFLYSKLNWKQLELSIVEYIAREGNAVIMLNSEGNLIVESIFRFKVYYDHQNKIARYAYTINGQEQPEMQNLRHGVDLYHIKDPVATSMPVAPSRLDATYSFILLEQKAIKANIRLFNNGLVGTIILKFLPEVVNKMIKPGKDENGKTWWENFMMKVNDTITGVKNANRVAYIPGLDSVIEAGKSNRESQFKELIQQITPERIAWAYSMNLSDFGSGSNTTYNNAATFDDALFDKFGRPMQLQLAQCINEFILKILYNLPISDSVYFQYNEPEDPNKILENKDLREDWLAGTITLNEYRDLRGMEPVDGGDTYYQDWVSSMTAPQLQDQTNSKNTNQEDKNQGFFLTTLKKYAKTPTERLIDSDLTKKFQERLQIALDKQSKAFIDKYKSQDDVNYAKVPKLESFYAFNVLKKDLLVFAGEGIKEFQKETKSQYKDRQFEENKKEDSFDGEYPQSVLDSVDQRTQMLLKGLGDYKGLDHDLTMTINTVLAENASLGVQALAALLMEKFDKLNSVRAQLIAHNEVANAVEGTRYDMYLDVGYSKKEWQTCNDNRVRQEHLDNEAQGQIGINEDFGNGEKRPADTSINCRCTLLYYEK